MSEPRLRTVLRDLVAVAVILVAGIVIGLNCQETWHGSKATQRLSFKHALRLLQTPGLPERTHKAALIRLEHHILRAQRTIEWSTASGAPHLYTDVIQGRIAAAFTTGEPDPWRSK